VQCYKTQHVLEVTTDEEARAGRLNCTLLVETRPQHKMYKTMSARDDTIGKITGPLVLALKTNKHFFTFETNQTFKKSAC